jgi:putative toxin-antitoxin system antitoxin component (TIGR02293 family)
MRAPTRSGRSKPKKSAEGAPVSTSGRAARLERTELLAAEILGNQARALHWLSTPNRALELRRPADLLGSDAGEREVREVLLRIDGGVYG